MIHVLGNQMTAVCILEFAPTISPRLCAYAARVTDVTPILGRYSPPVGPHGQAPSRGSRRPASAPSPTARTRPSTTTTRFATTAARAEPTKATTVASAGRQTAMGSSAMASITMGLLTKPFSRQTCHRGIRIAAGPQPARINPARH